MILTDWHHLFGMTLTDYFTGTAYRVELEKDLSIKKQLLDVVIIAKRRGKTETTPAELPDGLENLAAHNLVSFKSLHEPFDDWAADELIGHYVNYRKQIGLSLKKLLPKEHFRLYAVSTRYPRKLAGYVTLDPIKPHTSGVYDFRWGARDIRLIVTSRIAKKERNAAWLLFSAIQENIGYGVARYNGNLDEMSSTINQLLIKYKVERIIDMPYTVEDYRRELKRNVLNSLTVDDVLENFHPDELKRNVLNRLTIDDVLENFHPDEFLQKILAEKRLKGFSAEELLKSLPAEDIEAYLKKLRKKQKRK